MRRPVGFVELHHAWVDDRVSCTWGVQDLSLLIEPGRLVAFVDPATGRDGHAVLDLVAGRRHALRGTVAIDGADVTALGADRLRRVVTEFVELAGTVERAGERRLTVAGRTTLVADPRPVTLAAADLVVVLDAGREVARGRHHELLALGGRYASAFGRHRVCA